MPIVLTAIRGIPLIKKGDNLPKLILNSVFQNRIEFNENDIIVVTQKIVSKAEGRLINLNNVVASTDAIDLSQITKKDPRLIELILKESKEILRVSENHLIVEHKLGFICANAGIDHSNVDGEGARKEDWYLLLPLNPDQSAAMIKSELEKISRVRIGVLIIDSHGRAWRNGVVGTSIGVAGLPALVDLRGREDIFGYKLRITQVAAADELAAAASLVMGQADEKIPVVHVRGFPYPLRDSSIKELIRSKDQDLFR